MHNKLNSLLRIGESKHEAKKEYRAMCEQKNIKYNPAASNYIHSVKTADAYRQTIKVFCKWLKEEKNEIWKTKDLSKIDKKTCYEFLKQRDSVCSAWTVSKDMAALNKLLNHDLNKQEGNLKSRRLQDITKNRQVKQYSLKCNPENYKKQIIISKSFGLRRESILGGNYQVKKDSFFRYKNNIYVKVIEKNGRYREAVCLEKYKTDVKKIVLEKYKTVELQEQKPMSVLKTELNLNKKSYEELRQLRKVEFQKAYNDSPNDCLFDKYTTKINNHRFRAEYAQELYKQLAPEEQENKLYRGYDYETLKEVSEALGHNRVSVLFDHYLY